MTMAWKTVVVILLFGCQFGGLLVGGVSFEEDVRVSFEQKMAIDKLRRRVLPYITEEYMKDDIYLVKWLRGSDFDIASAERRLIENIKWRKEYQILNIDKEDFSDVAEEYPYTNDGFDKEGRPVFIGFAGDWDLRGAVVTGRVSRVIRYINHGLEMLARRVRTYQREGKNITQAILILDLHEFSLTTHACIQCLMRIVEILQAYESHFPGMADKILIVDAPPAVHFVIELAKQSVTHETRAALQVYGLNKAQWKEVLQKYIDRKYLPEELGGTAKRD